MITPTTYRMALDAIKTFALTCPRDDNELEAGFDEITSMESENNWETASRALYLANAVKLRYEEQNPTPTNPELMEALEDAVQQQNFYAETLNNEDNGDRHQFVDAKAFLDYRRKNAHQPTTQ